MLARESSASDSIRCPTCGCAHFYTIHVRHAIGRIRRRRQCRYCGKRVTTIERAVPSRGGG